MINPVWFVRNLRESASISRDLSSVLERMIWLYHPKLGKRAAPARRRLLRLQYAPPVGRMDILVRDNGGSDAYVMGEVFHHRYYELHPRVQAPRTIVDLGANAGFASLFFARCVPQARIIAVEPHPDNATLMRANFALNGVAAEVLEAACAVHDGRVLLRRHPMDYGHYVAPDAGAGPASADDAVSVEGISMPTLLQRFGLSEIGVLKLDVEGYEKPLLAGRPDWLSAVRAIVMEWHHPDEEEEVREIARRNGFREPERHRGQIWLLRP